MNAPTAFLSHNYNDKELATRIASLLREKGVDVWYDKWEIKVGDSIVNKIFKEGLAKCNFFIILLSHNSIESKWVQEELNKALVRKIEGATRILPIKIDDCQIPEELLDLRWIDLSKNFEEGFNEVLKTIYDLSEKPALGKPPQFIIDRKKTVAGLSPEATNIGLFILSKINDDEPFSDMIEADEIGGKINLTSQEINDAVEELEQFGMVKLLEEMGTYPYTFSSLDPTYELFVAFKSNLNYDPEKDIKSIAILVANAGEIDGNTIVKETGFPPGRINRAVEYLEDHGIVKVLKTLGTAPYNFYEVMAIGATRRFVKNI